MYKYSYILVSFILLSLASCKRQAIQKKEVETNTSSTSTTPDLVKVEPTTKKDNEATATNKAPKLAIKAADVDFKYLKLKSKVDFAFGSEEQSIPLTVHIKKDSIIWLSVVVGIEGARGIITQDSVMFLDRLHRTYYKYDFATLSKQFNFNLNYSIVQSILVGNMPIPTRLQDKISKETGSYLIKQEESFLKVDNIINEANLKLEKLSANDQAGNSNMQIEYSNFAPMLNMLFPQEIRAKINASQQGKTMQSTINIQHNKIDFLDQSPGFSFTIPKSYLPK